MKRNALFVFTLVFSIFLIASVNSASAQQQFLYAADGAAGNSANLMILDPANGAVLETIGPIGHSCTGLAFAPDGTLYGVTSGMDANPFNLMRINIVTGAGTLVTQMPGLIADITFSPQGALFGWAEGADDLAWINQTTAFAVIIADSGLSTYGNGLAFSPLPAPNGTLYLTGEGDNGLMDTINPTTGQSTSTVGLSGSTGNPIGGLAVNNTGGIYGVLKGSSASAPATLITINPTSGFITSIGLISSGGSPVPYMDAIAFSPIVCDTRTGFWVPQGEENLGTGVFIEIQRNTMAFAWGAFDSSGFATYVFATAARVGTSDVFTGNLLSFENGPTFAGPPTTSVTILPAGSVTVTFTNNTTATITGVVNSEAFNKTINKTFGE